MRFELNKYGDGMFYFKIVSKNNRILAVSEGYKRKANAQKAMNAIKAGMNEAPVIDYTKKK